MKSWLKDAKRVHDLGGSHPINSNLPWEEWDRKDTVNMDRWTRKLREPIPVAEPDRSFFGTRMHDSWLVGSQRTGSEYVLTLSCFFASIFAENLGSILGLRPEQIYWNFTGPFRVNLCCHGVTYQRTASEETGGWLKYFRIPPHEYKSYNDGAFLYDWFEQQDNRIQWIVELNLGPAVYVLTDCSSLSATDLREVDLVRAFGPNVSEVWKDVLNASKTVDLHYVLVREEIQKSMSAHGLTPQDFDTKNFRYSFREPKF
jgi:hypothetical protein